MNNGWQGIPAMFGLQKDGKIMKTKTSWLLIIWVALALAGCDRLAVSATSATPTPAPLAQDQGGTLVVQGNIVPRDFSRIYTRTGGILAEVPVKKGDGVAKDAVLVRFDSRPQAEAALAAAKLEQLTAQQALDTLNQKADVGTAQAQAAVAPAQKALIDAQQALADLDNQQYQDDLDKLQQDADTAKTELDDAQKEWDKYKNMDPSNQTRKDEKKKFDDAVKKYDDAVRARDLQVNKLDQAKAVVAQAQAALNDAQREADKRKSGPAADDLALAQSRLDNAKAQVTAAQQALDDLDVKAPYAGTVVELDHNPGDNLLPSMQVALVADLSQLYVETSDLTEMDVVKIAVGDTAKIKPDALSDLSLNATVTDIARDSGKKGGDVTYTARLKLDQTDPRLRWGMTVEVRIQPK